MFVSLWSTTSATLCAVLLSVASSVAAAAEESPSPTSESAYRLHHRIFHPAFERPLFAPRGLVHLRGPDERGLPFVESAKDVQEHMDGFAAALRTGAEAGENTDGVLYQVALERPGDANERAWDVSSVRACHLSDADEERLIVHLSPHDGTPYAIDYFISPVPRDGACPKSKGKGKSAAPTSFDFKSFSNTTVELRLGHIPPAPALRAPPPLTPQGQVKQPEPEKSFIQKYWIYIVGILLALLIAPGPEEGEGGAQKAGARPAK